MPTGATCGSRQLLLLMLLGVAQAALLMQLLLWLLHMPCPCQEQLLLPLHLHGCQMQLLLLLKATVLGVWRQWLQRLQKEHCQGQAGLQPLQLQQRQRHAGLRQQGRIGHSSGWHNSAMQRWLVAAAQQ